MLLTTDSTAFLIGQAIGFLFVFFLLAIFPMLAILRMAHHVGISGSDRVLWVIVIYCMPLLGPVTYFIWELTKGRKVRRAIPELVVPDTETPLAPDKKPNCIPPDSGFRTVRPRPGIFGPPAAYGTDAGRRSRTARKGKGPARYGLPPRR